ncbi:hypothetical protein L1277_002257 [Okibacterium sp. HSC-33S16]|nr:hypothetical protein [Okibacterium sp. HSC-33S16]
MISVHCRRKLASWSARRGSAKDAASVPTTTTVCSARDWLIPVAGFLDVRRLKHRIVTALTSKHRERRGGDARLVVCVLVSRDGSFPLFE